MNHFKHQLLTAIVLLASGGQSFAQTADRHAMERGARSAGYLSMETAVQSAAGQNATVRLAEMDERIAAAQYRQSDAVWLPQLSVGYQATATNNPLNAFGFLLQQQGVTQQSFDPNGLNSPGSAHNYATTVEARVPLVNLDAIFARKAARQQQEARRHQTAYTREYVAYETRKAYTQLQFAYAMRDILLGTLKDVKDMHRTVSNFLLEGLAQQSDVLNVQVQVSTVESALGRAESNIDNASEGLRLLMGGNMEQAGRYRVDSLTWAEDSLANDFVSETRGDLMAMLSALGAAKSAEQSSRMAFLPRLNAVVGYQWNNTKLMTFEHYSYMAGLSFSWTLFDGNRRSGKLREARIATQKVQQELSLLTDNSRLELNKTLRDLNDARREIRKHLTSVEHAAEALRILTNRQKEGLASTTNCLAAQAQLSQQRIALAKAVMDFNITRHHITLLTSSSTSSKTSSK